LSLDRPVRFNGPVQVYREDVHSNTGVT